MSKQVIQVGGSVRSGTTITGLILGNDDKSIMLGEVVHLFKPYNSIHREKINELSENPSWNRILNYGPKSLYKSIFEEFDNVETIVDSSKDPFWFKDQQKWNENIEIKNIVTYKTPKGLQRSFGKRGLDNWLKVYNNYYRRIFSYFSGIRSAFIDDILYDDEYLKLLCDYLDVNYSIDRKDYLRRNQPNFFGSKTINKGKIENKSVSQNLHRNLNKFDNKVYNELVRRDIRNNTFNVEEGTVSYNKILMNLYKIKDYHLRLGYK